MEIKMNILNLSSDEGVVNKIVIEKCEEKFDINFEQYKAFVIKA